MKNTLSKKTLFAMAIAAAGLTAVSTSFAQDTSAQAAQQGWYIGAQTGYANVDKGPYNDGDLAAGLKGGYRFALNPETSLGVEVGYQYLGQIDARGANGDAFASKLRGTTAGLNLRYNFSPSWYGEVRGGAFYAQGQGLTDTTNPTYTRFNRTSYYAGVGVGYNIDSNWSIGLNYDYYNGTGNNVQLKTNAYTVAAEYRF